MPTVTETRDRPGGTGHSDRGSEPAPRRASGAHGTEAGVQSGRRSRAGERPSPNGFGGDATGTGRGHEGPSGTQRGRSAWDGAGAIGTVQDATGSESSQARYPEQGLLTALPAFLLVSATRCRSGPKVILCLS